MKYIAFWLICLGVAIGLADDNELKQASENPSVAVIAAPVLATVEIIQLITNKK